ncbi:hypothetical protein [Salinibaculum salinum]|uniref:hypothetical protein n=1 Tax=Salinibaculum salinum TaxID=3131996 RepID=UPI0030EB1B0A
MGRIIFLPPVRTVSGFDWEPGIRDRLRAVVEDCGLAQQLPDEWTFADIVV